MGPGRGALAAVVLALAPGCLVGPDYARPRAPTAERWVASGEPRVRGGAADAAAWWRVFEDPTLDALVEGAYAENLTLRAAGVRVLTAQAQRGVAIGGLYPQTQQVTGSYTRNRASRNDVTALSIRSYDSFQLGLDAAWEVDLWGRFRRAIEAADADLLAAVADYDDVLVSLVAEVATTYVQARVIEERIALAHNNVAVQRESLRIVDVRYQAGGTSELDVQQATTLLADTEATIPQLEAQLRQAENALAVLLGLPPAELGDRLAGGRGIPVAPPTVAVGIPADLLRRRPDVQRAEQQLAAQSARIGVAKADLFPRLELAGTVGLSASDADKLFEGRSVEALGGPRVQWPILNYGRLVNAVRVQDATFQELVATYASAVLDAQRDVEDALAGYLRGTEQVQHLVSSVGAADRAVELALIQYREGAADYTRVLTAQQAKLREDDLLTVARGGVTFSVIALYRALGGGWELHDGAPFVPEETTAEMRDRTWWGSALDPDQVREAEADADEDRPWWRWRWWWPRW